MEALTKELRAINQVNRELQESLSEAAQTKKALRAQEFKLEEK